jgi:hypothetical protein
MILCFCLTIFDLFYELIIHKRGEKRQEAVSFSFPMDLPEALAAYPRAMQFSSYEITLRSLLPQG